MSKTNNSKGTTNKLNYLLWLVFKIGLPLGILILLAGTMFWGQQNALQGVDRIHSRISAVAEITMAIACLSLTAYFLMECYTTAKNPAKPRRLAITESQIFTVTPKPTASGRVGRGMPRLQSLLHYLTDIIYLSISSGILTNGIGALLLGSLTATLLVLSYRDFMM